MRALPPEPRRRAHDGRERGEARVQRGQVREAAHGEERVEERRAMQPAGVEHVGRVRGREDVLGAAEERLVARGLGPREDAVAIAGVLQATTSVRASSVR